MHRGQILEDLPFSLRLEKPLWAHLRKEACQVTCFLFCLLSATLHSEAGPFPNFFRKRIKGQIKAHLTSFYLKLQSRSFTQWKGRGGKKNKSWQKRRLNKSQPKSESFSFLWNTLPTTVKKKKSHKIGFCCLFPSHHYKRPLTGNENWKRKITQCPKGDRDVTTHRPEN